MIAACRYSRGAPIPITEMRSIVEDGADGLIIDDTRLAVETFRSKARAAGNP